MADCGAGRGKNFCINVPLKQGLRDERFVALFDLTIREALHAFRPEAIVLVAGADGLATDPVQVQSMLSPKKFSF